MSSRGGSGGGRRCATSGRAGGGSCSGVRWAGWGSGDTALTGVDH